MQHFRITGAISDRGRHYEIELGVIRPSHVIIVIMIISSGDRDVMQ